jgi:hypothetical protein
MFPATLANLGSNLGALAQEAVTGIPQPTPPDPNPLVSFMEAVNGLGEQLFGAEPVVDTSSTSFVVSRICSSVVGSLGGGLLAGAGRGAALGAEEAVAQGSTRGVAQTIAKTADPAYRPIASGKAAQLAKLDAENAARAAAREAQQIARQAEEKIGLKLVRSDGGGAGTRGTGKAAGGLAGGR